LYILARSAGKLAGARISTRVLDLQGRTRGLLGMSMLSQAGLAIGLVLATGQRFPQYAPTITTVVLAAVSVFEIIGPIGTRFALIKSGEAHPEEDTSAVLLD
jgi:hypothetical protein